MSWSKELMSFKDRTRSYVIIPKTVFLGLFISDLFPKKTYTEKSVKRHL